jgi:hypothetical protein
VAVEKLDIHKNSMILGNSKWSVAFYKSFVGDPDATLFGHPPASDFFDTHACRQMTPCLSFIVRSLHVIPSWGYSARSATIGST